MKKMVMKIITAQIKALIILTSFSIKNRISEGSKQNNPIQYPIGHSLCSLRTISLNWAKQLENFIIGNGLPVWH